MQLLMQFVYKFYYYSVLSIICILFSSIGKKIVNRKKLLRFGNYCDLIEQSKKFNRLKYQIIKCKMDQ